MRSQLGAWSAVAGDVPGFEQPAFFGPRNGVGVEAGELDRGGVASGGDVQDQQVAAPLGAGTTRFEEQIIDPVAGATTLRKLRGLRRECGPAGDPLPQNGSILPLAT